MKIIRILLIAVLPIVTGCSNERQPDHGYIPTQEDWDFALATLGEDMLGGCHHYIDPNEAGYSVDFFVKRGNWYAVVISVHNGHEGITQALVGYLGDDHTKFANIDTTKLLAGEFAVRYAELLNNDSCWTLIKSSPEWSEDSLRELWEKSKWDTAVFGEPWIMYSEIDLDLKRQQEQRDSILR